MNPSSSSIDPSLVVSKLGELKNIEVEIKRLNVQLKGLRQRKKQIEETVAQFLSQRNAKTAKTQQIAIELKETVRRPAKPKNEKEQDVMQILTASGVENAKETYEQIVNAMKGDETIKQTVKIKDAFKSKK